MGILKDIRQYFTGHDGRVLHTKYGDFNLSKEGDRKKIKKDGCRTTTDNRCIDT